MKKFSINIGVVAVLATPVVAIACGSKVAKPNQPNYKSKLSSELAKLQNFRSSARIDDKSWSSFDSSELANLNQGDEITSFYLGLRNSMRPYSYGFNKPLKEPLNAEIFSVVLKKPINQNKEITVTVYLRSHDKKYMESKDVTILIRYYHSNG